MSIAEELALARSATNAETLTQDERINLAAALEVGIERGKLRPFAAVEIARKLNLPLGVWIKAQADYLASATPVVVFVYKCGCGANETGNGTTPHVDCTACGGKAFSPMFKDHGRES